MARLYQGDNSRFSFPGPRVHFKKFKVGKLGESSAESRRDF
jgi:hypothetical protein